MNTYEIRHTDGHWILTEANAPLPLAHFITRPEAVLHSSQLVRRTGGSLQIYRAGETVEEEHHFPVPARAGLAAA